MIINCSYSCYCFCIPEVVRKSRYCQGSSVETESAERTNQVSGKEDFRVIELLHIFLHHRRVLHFVSLQFLKDSQRKRRLAL